MSSSSKGHNFERRVFKILKSFGFYAVRSAGSHGVFDVVGIKHGLIIGVQCKVNRNPTRDEMKAMANAYHDFGIFPIAAVRKKRKIFWINILTGDVANDLRILLDNR